MRYPLVLAALLVAAQLHAQAPPPVPTAPAVHFPQPPGPAPTPPAPQPGGVPVLAPGQLYVATADGPAVLLASPAGVVKITTEAGPLRLSGVFFDGSGRRETRTYKQPVIFIVEVADAPAGENVELLAIPGTVAKESDVLRQPLTTRQPGPQPPPVPPPPNPPVPADPFTAALQAAYAADPGPDKAASLAFLQTAYKTMAANVKPGLATNADALAWLRSVVEAPAVGLNATQLIGVRKSISTELANTLGTNATAPLDGVRLATELSKVATALMGVK